MSPSYPQCNAVHDVGWICCALTLQIVFDRFDLSCSSQEIINSITSPSVLQGGSNSAARVVWRRSLVGLRLGCVLHDAWVALVCVCACVRMRADACARMRVCVSVRVCGCLCVSYVH